MIKRDNRSETLAYRACIEHLSLAVALRSNNLVGAGKSMDKIKDALKTICQLWRMLPNLPTM